MLISDIFDFNAIQCCLITASLFSIPMKKRSYFPFRYLCGICLGLFCAPFIRFYQHATVGLQIEKITAASPEFLVLFTLETILNLLFYIIILTVFYLLSCKLHLLTAIYYATCTYLIQDLAYTIFVLILPDAAHRGSQVLLPDTLWLEIIILLACDLTLYLLLTKKLFSYLNQTKDCIYALAYMFLILCIGRTLGTFIKMTLSPDMHSIFRCLLLYDIVLTSSLLTSQILLFRKGRYQRELRLETQLRQQQAQQFKTFQISTETLRHKCHDLKHIIAALRMENSSLESTQLLQELELSVSDYDAAVSTGNETLDALLSQAWRQCNQHKIPWTCLADGNALNFISALDLYLLFGNALDNAIESSLSIPDSDKRFLSVNIRKVHQLALISVKNYYQAVPQFKDKLPVTTKNNTVEHGYGMKSIQAVVSKYNGQLEIHTDHNIFELDIMFPVP